MAAQKPDEDTWVNPDILYKSSVIDDTTFTMKDESGRLGDIPDMGQDPIFGPAVIFGGQLARWTGNDTENSGIIALESRLNFETKAGKRVTATFEIINTGTTSIYFDWRVKFYYNYKPIEDNLMNKIQIFNFIRKFQIRILLIS